MNASEFIKNCKRLVVKVGTTTLTYPNGCLNLQRIEQLSRILTDLKNREKEIILVTSGAIAVGADRLALPERPRDIKGKQAASAVGQAVLMQIYQNFFMTYNQKVAQILLTGDVFENAVRKTNAQNTFATLLSLGVIPIVNANDSVSIEELDFSDNDTLSAFVACLAESDALVILSDIDGLYDSDPKLNPSAKLIPVVSEYTPDIMDMAGDTAGKLGTGGMITKINAAKLASVGGIDTFIASGANPGVLNDIVEGNAVGTLFRAGWYKGGADNE